jgi:predicted PurR-regulated permease PerM
VTLAALVIVVAGLKAAGTILVPFLVAVFLAAMSAPLVLWLERRRVPAVVAVFFAMIVLIASLTAFGALLTTAMSGFNEALPGYQDALTVWSGHVLGWMRDLPFNPLRGNAYDALDPAALFGLIGSLVGGVVAALSNTALVILTVVFLLLEVAGFPRKLRLALDDPEADLGVWGVGVRNVQRYLVIKTLVSIATGALIAGWLALLGVDSPLLWGLLAFMLNYIPNVGSILAALPTILVALAQPGEGPATALLVAVGYLVVNVVLGNLLEPQLMGRRLGLSPLVVFLSLVFWGWVWGTFGMLLSVPLTVIVRIFLEQREDTRSIAILLGPAPPEAG